MTEKEFIQKLASDNRKFYEEERGRGALRDLQQIFPHSWLYVAELLQNALDAEAKRIRIVIENDGLVLEHDGKAFDQKDVEAICTRGVSTKGPGTIGFMGVGFKSVFHSFEEAQISSGQWHFKLIVPVVKGSKFGDTQRDWLGVVLPAWNEDPVSLFSGMTCRFGLSRRLPALPPIESDIEHVIGSEKTLLGLLAWHGVEEFYCNGEAWVLARSAEVPLDDDKGQRVVLEALDASAHNLNRWILFSAAFEPSTAAIRRFLEHRQINPRPEEREAVYAEASKTREVAIFCGLADDDTPLPVKHGSAFALLPTGVTFPIGLHIQADWLLVISRRELMEIAGNEWHQQVLEQIPRLLRYYLEWLVEIGRSGEGGWERGYDALPDRPRDDVENDVWFNSDSFRTLIRDQVEQVPWLPVMTGDDGHASFLAPKDARILPGPLARAFDDGSASQTRLFGERVASTHLLGVRATRWAKDLGLLHELEPAELVSYWKNAKLNEWYYHLSENEQIHNLGTLLAALAEMDEKPGWRTAPLCCVPTESGGWTDRETAIRLPLDWQVLDQESALQAELLPFVGVPDVIIARKLHNALLNPRIEWRTNALKYLEPSESPTLEEVIEGFWSDLSETIAAEQRRPVFQLTEWVRTKQPQRRALVKKLLTTDNGQERLLPIEKTLLADPYAAAFRRTIFADIPAVSPEYLSGSSEASATDWHSFFENLLPPPRGTFALSLVAPEISAAQLIDRGLPAPSRRYSYLELKWRGLSITSNQYRLLDAHLPSEICRLLQESSLSHEQSRAFALWLTEKGPDRLGKELLEYKQQKLAYIPYFQGYVQEDGVNARASWIESLSNFQWVFVATGSGPFAPCDVLGAIDPARPNAPVADLPEDLIRILEEAGVAFGTEIPNAPAIERLRIQGPLVDSTKLLELITQAVDEAGEDTDKLKFLRAVLLDTNLFPVPSTAFPVDGSMRISSRRIVRTTRGRSTLGDWVVAIEGFDEQSPERQALEIVHNLLPAPIVCDVQQVMDFVSWVWKTKPEAEKVRNILPRSYQYLREDVNVDAEAMERWQRLRPNATVFTSQRRWVEVLGNDKVFFDDQGLMALKILPADVQIATAGHLGDAFEGQTLTAGLIGLPLLSSRYRVEVQVHGALTVSPHWQQGFEFIQKQLLQRLETDMEENHDDPLFAENASILPLRRSEKIERIVLDGTEPISTFHPKAACLDGKIAVCGEPADFAEDLCRTLFDLWGLRLRRDLIDFLPKVAIQLTQLGSAEVVDSWLSGTTSETPLKPDENVAPGASNNVLDVTFHPNGKGKEIPKEPEKPADKEEKTDHPFGSSGYVAEDREGQLKSWLKQKKELERKIAESATLGVIPPIEDEKPSGTGSGEFPSDQKFRDAVTKFELQEGRFPILKLGAQAGHDIDSFTHPEGHPDRRLGRRIEVKGKGVPWENDEIVVMSDRQYLDAFKQQLEDGTLIAPDFDYWLYVVEEDGQGNLHVLPIQNPARAAGHYELRGGTWRHLVESSDESDESIDNNLERDNR